MKILVTGANGYIGSHVVKKLLDMGCQVVACDVCLDRVDARAEGVSLNLFDLPEDNLYSLFGSPDVCLHMAWRNGFVHNADTQIGDLSAHYALLTRLVEGGLRHLSVMGSMHEVGYWEGAIDEDTPCKPLSLYGVAKNTLREAMSLYCSQRGVMFQWLRGFYILGDDRQNNSIFCKILQASDRGDKLFPFTTGQNKYDFETVYELAGQIAAVVTQDKVNGIINCCSGQPMSLADRVEQFIRENGLDIRLDYGRFPDRPYDSPCIYGDNTKIKQIMQA